MKIHELKIDPQWFGPVFDNDKRFEMRNPDRGFEVGDILLLRETEYSGIDMMTGAALGYTGKSCHRLVTHVADVGLESHVMLSIRPLTKTEKACLK